MMLDVELMVESSKFYYCSGLLPELWLVKKGF